GDAGDLLRRQGGDPQGARSAAPRAQRLREGGAPREGQARVLQQDRGAARRDGYELAPRGGRLGWRARYRRQEDDGSRRVPLQEGDGELHGGGFRQVPVPAHRQGRLADDVQDPLRDGGSP